MNHDARDAILLGLVGSVGFLILTYFLPALAVYPDSWTLPFLMRFRPQAKISGNVVIAAIDNQTIYEMGRPPWTEKQYADLISALGEYGPRVVGLPVLLQERDRAPASLRAPLNTRDTVRNAVGQEISDGPLKARNLLSKLCNGNATLIWSIFSLGQSTVQSTTLDSTLLPTRIR